MNAMKQFSAGESYAKTGWTYR